MILTPHDVNVAAGVAAHDVNVAAPQKKINAAKAQPPCTLKYLELA